MATGLQRRLAAVGTGVQVALFLVPSLGWGISEKEETRQMEKTKSFH